MSLPEVLIFLQTIWSFRSNPQKNPKLTSTDQAVPLVPVDQVPASLSTAINTR